MMLWGSCFKKKIDGIVMPCLVSLVPFTGWVFERRVTNGRYLKIEAAIMADFNVVRNGCINNNSNNNKVNNENVNKNRITKRNIGVSSENKIYISMFICL